MTLVVNILTTPYARKIKKLLLYFRFLLCFTSVEVSSFSIVVVVRLGSFIVHFSCCLHNDIESIPSFPMLVKHVCCQMTNKVVCYFNPRNILLTKCHKSILQRLIILLILLIGYKLKYIPFHCVCVTSRETILEI